MSTRLLIALVLGARAIVRKYVPDLPITYNPTDPFGPTHSGQDWWNLKEYDLSLEQIAAATGTTVGTVKTHLFRATATLRQLTGRGK